MDDKQRGALRRAVVRCRTDLEADYARQLEGSFGITAGGRIADEAQLPHLDARGLHDRRAIVAAIEHLVAGGMTTHEAVEAFVRESAFSTLNRLTAIKLMEAPARRLVMESLGSGSASRGFRQFALMSPEAMRAEPDGGYRLYLELLCEDLSSEVGVLFDLRLPQGILFPSELALRAILDELNSPELAPVWAEDETLGWVYQYFTPKEMRDEARKASAAPRNANELAFRNQFYTPRYVVEFLTDNTLGRLWYEMRQGQTRLAEQCRYLVRRSDEVFLGEMAGKDVLDWMLGEPSARFGTGGPFVADVDLQGMIMLSHAVTTYDRYPTSDRELWERHAGIKSRIEAGEPLERFATQELLDTMFLDVRADRHSGGDTLEDDPTFLARANEVFRRIEASRDPELPRDERLRLPAVVPYRRKRDPRTLRILDPACGSGHFLLYAFELLLTIYAEAWDDPEFGPALIDDYGVRENYDAAVPLMILEHNLHGIDIDLRAVQIAQLALWLRAQRVWAQSGIRPAERPNVRRVNIVATEPPPGDHSDIEEFIDTIQDRNLAAIVRDIWKHMADIGEIGSMLKAFDLANRVVDIRRDAWTSGRAWRKVSLFDGEPQDTIPLELLDSLNDPNYWETMQPQALNAFHTYADQMLASSQYETTLFANDLLRGYAILKLFEMRFDIVLMNPPFGAVAIGTRKYFEIHYPRTKNDLYAAFVERGIEILRPGGLLGAITSRTGFFLTSFQKWREEILLREARPSVLADLGYGVLDTAMVETAAYVLEKQQ